MSGDLTRRSALRTAGLTAAAVGATVAIAACTRDERNGNQGGGTDMTDSTDRRQALSDAEFDAGYPTDETSTMLTDELYFQRATQSYLWSLPAVNMYAMKKGLGAVAGTGYNASKQARL